MPSGSVYIEAFGIRLVRFMNVEVCDNLDGVIDAIARALGLGRRTPLYPPFVRGERFTSVPLHSLGLIQR